MSEYEPMQMWNEIETKQALIILERLLERARTFGILNMDPNTEKCLAVVAQIYELRDEQLDKLDELANARKRS